MAIHKSEGIILSTANWSESSQTITLFTPDRGKLVLNVREARRLTGKRGRPMTFARLEFSYYLRDGGESGYLSDIEPVEVFLFEKEGQLGRLTFASASLELLGNLLIVSDPQPACYQITLSFLRMVDSIDKNRLPGLFAGYIFRVISLLGFRPNLAGCAGCGNEVAVTGAEPEVGLFFSIERGGLVCDDCRRAMPGQDQLIGLSEMLRSKMLNLMESSLEEAARIPVTLSELNAMMNLVTSLLKYHSGTIRPLKSFDFLEKLTRAVKAYGG